MSFRRMRHVKAREFQGCDIAYDFSNPATLYDATSGGSLVAADGAIARANDVSGGSANLTQGSDATRRPLRKVAALNGLDVARFDGSNDLMTAGDVADMLDKPVTAIAVYKNSTSSLAGVFGKSAAAAAAGRWSIIVDSSKDKLLFEANVAGLTNDYGLTQSTVAQVFLGEANRAGSSATVVSRRNAGASTASTSTYNDNGTSYNTPYHLFVGAYQNVDGLSTYSNSYVNGDIGELAKWSVLMPNGARLRLEQSRCRKWRIAS